VEVNKSLHHVNVRGRRTVSVVYSMTVISRSTTGLSVRPVNITASASRLQCTDVAITCETATTEYRPTHTVTYSVGAVLRRSAEKSWMQLQQIGNVAFEATSLTSDFAYWDQCHRSLVCLSGWQPLAGCLSCSYIVLKRQKIPTQFVLHKTAPCLFQILIKFGLHLKPIPPQSDPPLLIWTSVTFDGKLPPNGWR